VSGIPKRSLRAMRDRWQRDLDRIEAAYPIEDMAEWSDPESETQRNLATAIVWIEGLISRESRK
jgi:hypothetical protein